ncbi:MAG: DUF4091 domain-containing protein [Candidatus Hydrogenedentes bacterium]|nr:DUF4091 domain-containing protein [Candidatus Hydrogenedentota bacterium]
MRISCAFLLPVCLTLTAATFAQQVGVPNPSFESAATDGTSAPDAWTLSGGEGAWDAGAADGARCVSVTGNGAPGSSNYWRTAALPFAPFTVCRLRFEARRVHGGGGCAITGPAFCNRDLGELTDSWQECTSVFVTPSEPGTDQRWLRFGQWEMNGTVAYDTVELAPAQAVYRSMNGIALGEGESIAGDEYVFRAPYESLCTNHARPLAVNRCTFNTWRWAFGTDSEVVYRHEIGGIAQTRARVELNIGHYVSGALAVEASRDGAVWQTIGTLAAPGTGAFDIPADLLPAPELRVRLSARADAAAPADLQVNAYTYTARLERAPGDLRGATQYVAIAKSDPRLEVEILSLGDAIPGGDNVFRARVRNLTDHVIAARPRLVVTGGGVETRERTAIDLAPGNNEIAPAYTLRATGRNDAVFSLGGGIAFRAETTFHVADLYCADFGAVLPDSSDAVGLWWAASGWKISDTRPVPGSKDKALRIQAARNETEAAQLVVRPSMGLQGLTATAGPLDGPGGARIGTENIDVLRVRYVPVTRPTDRTGAVAPWPDPLPPFSGPITVAANKNQPLWVRVHVPEDAAAGVYRGAIMLRAEGFQALAPVEVEVFDFTMPDRMTCVTAFGFGLGRAFEYQDISDPSHQRQVCDQYLAALSAHHITPYNPAPMDSLLYTWPEIPKDRALTPEEIAALKPTFQWDAWDRAMTKAFDEYHFNSFSVGVPGMGGGTFHSRHEPELQGFKEDSPEYQALFNSWCGQVEAHLRGKGWLDMSYVYWFDEPDPKDYAFVMNGFRKLKEAAPGIGRMLTEQVEPELTGGPNIWCPVTPEYDHDAAEARRAEGDHFWWYVCTGPKAPYVTLFIDHPGTEMRVWLWQTWQRKIEGILVWETTYWHSPEAYPDRLQNPYEDPMGWTTGYSTPSGTRLAWGNGDGRFLYPPEAAADGNPGRPVLDPPVDTVRIEMLRDGIEDYEYLAMLRRLLAAEGGDLSARQRADYEALLTVPAEITASMTEFTKDPAPIARHREAVARAIEHLSR